MKRFFSRLFCKHEEQTKVSCPFTGRTYSMCNNCDERIAEEVTASE